MSPSISGRETRETFRLSLLANLFVGAVIVSGLSTLAMFAPRQFPRPLLALTLLASMLVVSLFKLRIPLGRGESTLSMAYVVDFAVIVTSGAGLAMAIAAIGTLVQCTVNVKRRQPWSRTAFSVATVVLGVGAAGAVWTALGGQTGEVASASLMLPLLLAGAVYFAVNSGLVATAIGASTAQSPLRVWTQHFAATAPTTLVAAGAVAMFHGALSGDPYSVLALAAVPMAALHVAYARLFRRQAAHMATA